MASARAVHQRASNRRQKCIIRESKGHQKGIKSASKGRQKGIKDASVLVIFILMRMHQGRSVRLPGITGQH